MSRTVTGLSVLACLMTGLLVASGCQSGPGLPTLSLFQRPTPPVADYQTPGQRIEAIRAVAKLADGKDSEAQQKLVTGLVGPLATEDDPLVRQATLEAVAEFNTALAGRALLAALDDSNAYVRETACLALGERGMADAAPSLAQAANSDEDFDVRLAAAKALGQVGADKSMLLAILEDPNPAMQLVGVEAMQKTTGQDLGRDVAAYVALAKGETPAVTEGKAAAIADRRLGWLPF